MKTLVLITSADAQQRFADALRGIAQVQGFTFTHVEGHGAHARRHFAMSAYDRVVGYEPYLRVEILLADEDVASVLAALKATDRGVAGECVYWVTSVEQQGRL